jgi:hypothetical protein
MKVDLHIYILTYLQLGTCFQVSVYDTTSNLGVSGDECSPSGLMVR